MDEEKKDLVEETVEPEAGGTAGDEQQVESAAEDIAAEDTAAEDAVTGEQQDEKKGIAAFFADKKRLAIIAGLVALIVLFLGLGIAFGKSGFGSQTNSTLAQTEGESLLARDQETTAADESEAAASGNDDAKVSTPAASGESETQDEQETTADEEERTSEEAETSKGEKETEEQQTTDQETTKATDEAETTVKPQETTVVPKTTKAPETTAVPPATTPSATKPVQTESGTPYGNHGKLTVSGTNILDQNGDLYQLRGVSTHGIGWFPDYVNKAAFQTMRDEWGINVVRIAMYTAEYNGYCSGGDQTWLKNLVDTGVQAATELGLYVIIDWHILSDSNPNTNKAASLAFFKEISAKYASYGNVLYEICNEPNGGVSWGEIKSYAEEVIPVIRANAKDAVIIVGTPTWSQDVDQAAANPITGQINIMYALHFYAATHKDDLRNKMINAIAAGLPVFVTEYGICDASGNGGIDEASANAWVAAMNQRNVSYCIWNLSNKSETSALINSGCTKTSGWTNADLSASGKWFVNMMKGSLDGLGTTQPTQSQGTQTQPAQSQAPTETQTEYVAPTTQAPQQASSGNCSVQANNTNSWGDASQGYHMQLDVNIQNTGSSAVTGWKVVLTFSGSVEVESSWNGNMAVNGSTITITSDADWNATLQPGGGIQPGLIVKSASEIKLTGCSIQ